MVRRALHLGLAAVVCVGVSWAVAGRAVSATIVTPNIQGTQFAVPVQWSAGGLLVLENLSETAPPTILAMNGDGSNARTIAAQGENPTWSPDGTKVAYDAPDPQGAAHIWVANANGSGAVQLAGGEFPSWSPDGTKLAFDTGRSIETINADGSNPAVLDLSSLNAVNPLAQLASWSPDGANIAFYTFGTSAASINAAPVAGGQIVPLTPTLLPYVTFCPCQWSPDGLKLLFRYEGNNNVNQIYVVNRDGSGLQALTPDTSNAFFGSTQGAWSPDGSKITYTSDADGDYEIYTMNADGTNVDKLTDNTFNDTTSVFSPDGTQLAIGSDRCGAFGDVFVIPATGDPDPTGHCPPQYAESVVAGAGDGQALVQWAAARAATSYTVTASPGGRSTTVDGSLSQATIGGLTNGTPYTFTVVTNLGAESSIPSQPSTAVTPQLGAVIPTIAIGFANRVTATTIATGTVPTPANPLTTAVTYPANVYHADLTPPLTIVQSTLTSPAPSGYQFFGQEIDIAAPLADPFNPITLVFSIDNSLLGATAPADVQIFRDGSPIADCTSSSVTATPDPCITSRVAGSSDVAVTVYSSHASRWNIGRIHQTDAVAPIVTYSAHPASYTVDQQVSFTCTATDPAPSSGLASNTCANVNGPAYSFGLGPHTFHAQAKDNAGNQGQAMTLFSVVVTDQSLCNLTVAFVKSSSKYQALTPKQRAAVDALSKAACDLLATIGPKLSPKQKAAAVTAYQAAVAALVKPGWLTTAQATTLAALTSGL